MRYIAYAAPITTPFVQPEADHSWRSQVYVLRTATRAEDPAVISELRSIMTRYAGVLLLLDPDVAGRQARNQLNAALGGCWHAFIPTTVAIAEQAVRTKAAGDIGVEHASPGAIRAALHARRKSTPGRTVFTRDALEKSGLIAPLHERVSKSTDNHAGAPSP